MAVIRIYNSSYNIANFLKKTLPTWGSPQSLGKTQSWLLVPASLKRSLPILHPKMWLEAIFPSSALRLNYDMDFMRINTCTCFENPAP